MLLGSRKPAETPEPWPLPILQEFETVDEGPDEILLGFHVYTKMKGRADFSVWSCAKAARGYNTTGQCRYFFKIGKLYLTAHGAENMVTPQEVQAAYMGGRMSDLCGSLEDASGKGPIQSGYHAWDSFVDGHWARRDLMIRTVF